MIPFALGQTFGSRSSFHSTPLQQGRGGIGQALVYSACAPMTAEALRQAVVAYLTPLGKFFADRLVGRFQGRYSLYLQNLRQQGTWGDELSLLAAAHIFRRPVHVVSDSSSDDHFRIVCPPSFLAESLWGDPIFLTLRMDVHYDATCVLEA